MLWCLQDKKKQGAAYDDLSAQYEIDHSELEPLDHIPPLCQVGMHILYSVLLSNVLKEEY